MEGGRYSMPQWTNSTRRDRLPSDWPRIRRRVLRRDQGLCQWKLDEGRCLAPATDVDHIRPGDNHDESNLRSLCYDHHQFKSSQEGAAAAKAKRRQIQKKFRRVEDHPGMT